MILDDDPATSHRAVAAVFTARVAGTTDWDAVTPVEGWVARDVVRHLVEWLSALLTSRSPVVLPGGPSVDDDPVGAWRVHTDAVQALLDDPATARVVLSDPYLGDLPVPEAIARLYTPDVFMHTWDLATATGQPHGLDQEVAAAMLSGMEPLDEVLRRSGHYGPRVDVPADADAVSRLMGFVGRRPAQRQDRTPGLPSSSSQSSSTS